MDRACNPLATVDLWYEGASPPIDLYWFAGSNASAELFDLASVATYILLSDFPDTDTTSIAPYGGIGFPARARRREQRDPRAYLTWERE